MNILKRRVEEVAQQTYGATGFFIGMQKGMQKEKEVTARIMKSKGLSLELISECTGLTTEEIEKLE